MAYNLQPLITILEQILDPQQTCWNTHDDSKPQLKSLLKKAISLQQILEKHSLPNIEISLEREIRDVAHKAEDIIESRMVDGMLSTASVTEESMVKLVETTSGGGMIISSRGSSSSGGGGASIQSQSLLEKAISLQQILEKHPLPNIEISLGRQIRDAARIAEDIIESRMVRPIRSRNFIESWCKCFTFSSPNLQQVMRQLDSAMEQVLKLVEVEERKIISSRGTSSLSSGVAFLNPKSAKSKASTVVGFDEDLMKLKNRLTRMQTKLEIIPIVGMGGAGKTTLARNLYEDPTIVSRFDARAWTTVSQDHDMHTILLSLLHCIIEKDQHAELIKKQVIVDELKEILYKSLFGRRYLIVLDDIWSTKVWNEMRMFFPDNYNGCRIVITTRESNVARYANSQIWQHHEVKLLSEYASWDLLCQIVFGEDDCPSSLKWIGRKMVNDCGRLPLAITVIGGLLSKVERSEYVWENIRKKIISLRCECITFSSADLQQVMLELDSAMEQVVKLVEVEAGNKMMISSRGPSSSSVGGGASLNPKSASGSIHVVGFDEDLMELKDRLTNMQSKLEIIPIVGMGGAGKTTLARKLYEDQDILSRFQYAHAWATVSQDYDMQTILSSLLSCIIGKDQLDELIKKQVTVDELKDVLYKSLYGRRYMIVLDDVWSTKVWDAMRRYFPDNNNGSRIVITTRESNVARYANSQSQQHEVKLLSESASWDLLRQIVFGEDDCPFVLESMGRKMASDCGGLPLAITVIGGLLSKVERSEGVWENIRKNVRGAIAKSEEGEQYSNIMSLSYKHLPNYLKPCFLYMAAFPEDYEIKGSRLIRLWIAEGFVKSNGSNKSLEEEAEDYLKGLVARNLVMVRRYKSNRKARSYIIHDVLRDLCIKKADEDNFLHVIKNENDFRVSKLRRVSCQESCLDGILEEMYGSTEVMSLARSFLCTVHMWYMFSVSKLLRVLDIMQKWLEEFPEEILQLVNLRYLGVNCNRLPVGIYRLLNLQTLIADLSSNHVPSEIWTMSELRHLKLIGGIYWRKVDWFKELVEMNKLQTISGYLVLTESLFERGFLETIPNIKNLGVHWEGDSEIDFSHLHKLETLRYSSGVYNSNNSCRFPPSLRKLTLYDCRINGRMTSTLCGLPNLEVLKIKDCVFEVDSTGAQEWEARQGEEFRSLQFLHIRSIRLKRWRADETNFPELRHLLVEDCLLLEEIPSGIGEIPTLELIQMKDCSAAALESANQIVEEQQSYYGNYALQLRIFKSYDSMNDKLTVPMES